MRGHRHKPILFEQLRQEQREAQRSRVSKPAARIAAYNLTMQLLGIVGKVVVVAATSVAASLIITAVLRGRSPIDVAMEWWRWLWGRVE